VKRIAQAKALHFAEKFEADDEATEICSKGKKHGLQRAGTACVEHTYLAGKGAVAGRRGALAIAVGRSRSLSALYGPQPRAAELRKTRAEQERDRRVGRVSCTHIAASRTPRAAPQKKDAPFQFWTTLTLGF
jgi:hypothetical protein